MDYITIRKLEVFAKHGVFQEEKTLGQRFIISVELYVNLRDAGKTDDLNNSVDYGIICHEIKEFVDNNSFNLIETIAEGIAGELLNKYPKLDKIVVEVEKPQAPIAMRFETVAVRIERSRHRVFIALGSNVGDREAHLQFAISELNKTKDCRVLDVSKLINTAPYGNVEQDDFLNGCLELETLHSPHELLELLKNLEKKRDRVRDKHWGPRTLDLDIIFFDDLIMSDNLLRIPHIDAHRRDFVLIPLAEIAPNFLHPVLMKSVSELLEEI